MKRELLQHRTQYLILCVGLGLLTLLFLGVWPNHFLQRLVVIAISLFYMAWGITTHVHTDRISKRVVYEYLSIGALAGLILFLVTI